MEEFLQQRKRWASKSVKYKDNRIVTLIIGIWLFNVSFIINLIWGFFSLFMFKVFCIQFLIKLIAELFFLSPVMDFSRRKKILAYLPILTIIHVLYFIYIGIAGNSGKYNWKGRMVK